MVPRPILTYSRLFCFNNNLFKDVISNSPLLDLLILFTNLYAFLSKIYKPVTANLLFVFLGFSIILNNFFFLLRKAMP